MTQKSCAVGMRNAILRIYLKSNSTSLCNKGIQNFLILLDKSLFFEGFSCLYEKYVSSPVFFLCMIFAEITFCPSINLEQPVMVLALFLTYQLSCRMRQYLILSCTTELTGPRPYFACTAAFLFKDKFSCLPLKEGAY